LVLDHIQITLSPVEERNSASQLLLMSNAFDVSVSPNLLLDTLKRSGLNAAVVEAGKLCASVEYRMGQANHIVQTSRTRSVGTFC